MVDGPRNTGYPPGIAPGSEQAYRNGMTELNVKLLSACWERSGDIEGGPRT